MGNEAGKVVGMMVVFIWCSFAICVGYIAVTIFLHASEYKAKKRFQKKLLEESNEQWMNEQMQFQNYRRMEKEQKPNDH